MKEIFLWFKETVFSVYLLKMFYFIFISDPNSHIENMQKAYVSISVYVYVCMFMCNEDCAARQDVPLKYEYSFYSAQRYSITLYSHSKKRLKLVVRTQNLLLGLFLWNIVSPFFNSLHLLIIKEKNTLWYII